jgi:RNA polymerase sigma-70 factor (ECF subfamily)
MNSEPGPAALAPVLAPLLERYRTGDREALNDIVKVIAPLVRRIVFRLLGFRAAAAYEDLTQSCLEQICLAVDGFRSEGSFTAFVYGVCHRTVVRTVRYERLRRWFRPLEGEIFSRSSPEQPDELLERKKLLLRADAALARLTVDERTVFVLHDAEGVVIDQIAEALRCSTRTVKRRLRAAREKLLDLKQEEGGLAR